MFINHETSRRSRFSHSNIQLLKSFVALGLTAYFVPLTAPLLLFGRLARELDSTFNTQLVSVTAALSALLIFRKVTSYPGERAFSFIVPAFSTTFGVAAALLLFSRVPYSGAMLLTGYIASVGITFLFGFLDNRNETERLYYLPHGDIEIVPDARGINWIRLAEPMVPDDPAAAIVADLRYPYSPEWEKMLAEAAISGMAVYHVKHLRESLTGRVQIEHLSENSFGSLLPAMAYRGVKRLIDIVSSLALLPLLALPMLLIAVLVRWSSPGPILFKQTRMGYRGERFKMLKFRTMINAPDASNVEGARHAAITQDEDSRVTPIGRALRKSRLDELPQIVNILRGEMSWIGPRPEAVPLSQWYEEEIPFYRYRHIVRPGITGWAQVNQGHVAGIDDVHVKLHYDFYYVKFFSFWLDVLIALRTIGIMASGYGAR